MSSLHKGEAEDEIRLSQGLARRTLQRTSVTGLTVSITHLILSRALSHVIERLIVVIASSASWRAFSAGDIPAHRSAAGGIGVLISLERRSVEGERVSEPVATMDRVVFVESWAIEGFVASLGDDSLTSVDRRSVAWMGKTGLEAVFGDTMTVK